MATANKKKYDFLLYLLEEGDAMVCLDSRHPQVDVPATHKNNSSLNLVFNLNFRHPMKVTAEGIFATLVFNGKPYECVLPFNAMWAIHDSNMKNGQVWEESIPRDVDLAAQAMKAAPKKPRAKLQSIKRSGKPAKESATGGKRDRNHLRVIK